MTKMRYHIRRTPRGKTGMRGDRNAECNLQNLSCLCRVRFEIVPAIDFLSSVPRRIQPQITSHLIVINNSTRYRSSSQYRNSLFQPNYLFGWMLMKFCPSSDVIVYHEFKSLFLISIQSHPTW